MTTTIARETQTTAAKKTQVAGIVTGASRIVISFLFGFHGLQGFGFFGGIDGQGGGVPFGSFPGWWGSVFELVGALLLLVGLASRPAAILLSGVMAYAYFTVHAPMGLLPLQNTGEPAAVYAWIFLLFAAIGPGRFALDTLVKRRR
ncbi:putative oxidoreductase [Amycolatopsis lexingtonensis]|uniref:Oxidoreductase n=1 Tax=Amycolatopsis lexingtonensis TaxID=218822 RepID=A0ABR9IE54_9PSEU|nr:DoxX family protein [Amycolatopsis lexingtonensis]MBE1501445.1 putative oxidoreductase [Amycolatopsis lexingtonensis]